MHQTIVDTENFQPYGEGGRQTGNAHGRVTTGRRSKQAAHHNGAHFALPYRMPFTHS
ncbi:hypothetical protein [Streptomyces europaeiscabiei]|uniref:hypothetical protein n=1 Tax=Streptomyces europaeiscabiei TaxID=146819 RepID=UPI002E0D799F|nr:hypothetical protein OHB30_40305 [Streptomyces europaeiscabiei]